MKIPVEAINAPIIWYEGGTAAYLEIAVLEGFTTSEGQFVPPTGSRKLYQKVPITIGGNIPLITGFELDSTIDASPWNSDVIGDMQGYRATIVTTKGIRIPYFPAFQVPTIIDGDPSLTWGELRIFNTRQQRKFIPEQLIKESQVRLWIQTAVGELNKGSSTNTGGVALSADPTDPVWPYAVGTNDALWQLLQSGAGLTSAIGTEAMTAGRATVTSVFILSTSVPMPIGLDAGITGALHIENLVDGSFDIVSSNLFGDNGQVGWVLYNP